MTIAWLVVASLFFYGWWNPNYLALIGFSIIVNYCTGRLLVYLLTQGSVVVQELTLGVGIAINLTLLGYFKYANFFVDNINYLTGSTLYLETIVLPIAISFFTFQQIAYLVDTKRRITQEHSFVQYCLFVVFFPQLIAGPIVHHKEMLPQFLHTINTRPWFENLSIGGTIFCIGLFKKVVIADNLAPIATVVFDAAQQGVALHMFQAWTGTIAYSLQLYFDFSGYSDMAIGLALMFGIRLPLNFNSPYKATSIIDFWRRWHMTLTRFLRDYVYIPLGGNRKGRIRRYINIALTMLLGGLWHGAAWTFVIWGALHGLFIIVNHLWRKLWGRPIDSIWSRFIARSLTLLIVSFAWVFFRAETFEGALAVIDGMATLPTNMEGKVGFLESIVVGVGVKFGGEAFYLGEIVSLCLWLIFWVCLLWTTPNAQQWLAKTDMNDANKDVPLMNFKTSRLKYFPLFAWNPSITWAIVVSGILACSLLSLSQVSEFLYYEF